MVLNRENRTNLWGNCIVRIVGVMLRCNEVWDVFWTSSCLWDLWWCKGGRSIVSHHDKGYGVFLLLFLEEEDESYISLSDVVWIYVLCCVNLPESGVNDAVPDVLCNMSSMYITVNSFQPDITLLVGCNNPCNVIKAHWNNWSNVCVNFSGVKK